MAVLPGAIPSLVIDPSDSNIVYATTDDRGIYKSTNRGESWFRAGPAIIIGVRSMAIDPTQTRNLYIAAGRLYKSTDAGANWFPTGLTELSIETVVVDPNNGNTVYAGNRNGVFKSTDGGQTWEPRNQGLTNTTINHLAVARDSGRIYAATGGAGVWFSDQAETWE